MQNLIQKLNNLSRVQNGIAIGDTDIHNRKFKPDGRFFTSDGKFSDKLQSLINSLSDPTIQTAIEAGIMYYDIRSKFWRENPEFTAVLALAYARKLQQKTNQIDGHVLFLAVDCYSKHFEAAQVFADTILRTGICDNGGGIYYWGIMNGGDVRNYGQLYHAVNKEGGHWVYFTMSHRPEDFIGAKMGINAKVFCGSEIRHCEGVTSGTLFDTIINREFVPIKNTTYSGDNLILINNCLNNNIQVAADMIKATSAPVDTSVNRLLSGIEIGIDMGGSPTAKNTVDILKALGAKLTIDNGELDKDYNTQNIIDPNEHHTDAVNHIKKRVMETGITWIMLDPDADRGSFVAINSQNEAVSLTGSQLLLLTIENMAKSYKVKNIIPTIICDMRTGVGAKDLEKILIEKNLPVKVVPVEAGYPFFMRQMANLPADVAVENTSHEFTNPMTNQNWGAPQQHNFPGYQGGDNAGLFLIYLLGCMKNVWENRNPIQQLEWIYKNYGLKETIVDERKPALPPEFDRFKYQIADKMKELAVKKFIDPNEIIINFGDPTVTLVSGVHLTNTKTKAMTLVRFSNTGSSFTLSGEAYTRQDLDFMFKIAYQIMLEAVNQLGGYITNNDEYLKTGLSKDKQFPFFENDAAPYNSQSI